MRPCRFVEAKSNRPGDAPAINPPYLSKESDRRAIVDGLRAVDVSVMPAMTSTKTSAPTIMIATKGAKG